jgi:dihydropteroate synthase
MHSRGEFETMHQSQIDAEIIGEVSKGFSESIGRARKGGVKDENIALDIGIGFSKSFEQNLELLAKLDRLCKEFQAYPILAGTSRKSFIGKILDQPDTSKRLSGSLATISLAIWKGAKIVRVHDVKESADAIKTIEAIRRFAA